MVVVLGLNDGQRDVGLVEQDVVSAENGAFVSGGLAATDDDPARTKRVLGV
jgi:hypothetical protein